MDQDALISRSPYISQRAKKLWSESFNRRMIGFTLCRAWVYVSFFSSAMMVLSADGRADQRLIYLISLVALIICLFVCGFIGEFLERSMMKLAGRIAPAALTVLGSLLVIPANSITPWGILFMGLAGVLTGVGSGLILVYWGRVYSTTGGPTSAAECSLAFVLSTMLVPFFAVLSMPAQVVILTVLPIASCILLNKEFDALDHAPYLSSAEDAGVSARPGEAESLAEEERLGTKLLWKISFAALVFGSVLGVVRGMYTTPGAPETFVANLDLPIAALIAAVVILALLLLSRRLDLTFTYKPIIIFMTIACLIMPLMPKGSPVAYVLAMAGYFCFEIMNWVIYAGMAYRYNMNAYRVYGFGRSALAGGVLLGEVLGKLLGQPQILTTEQLYALSLGFVVLMIITYTLTLTERDVARITRLESRPFKLPASAFADEDAEIAALAEQEAAPRELTIDEKVELLAAKYEIDGRALDVLQLLAKGRTAARIEQELYVSRGTVNTYSHKIYQKLGIHSRQELFDLVDSMEEE